MDIFCNHPFDTTDASFVKQLLIWSKRIILDGDDDDDDDEEKEEKDHDDDDDDDHGSALSK